jgi:hypothetical protein
MEYDFEESLVHLSIFEGVPLFILNDVILHFEPIEHYCSVDELHPVVALIKTLATLNESVNDAVGIKISKDVAIELSISDWPEVENKYKQCDWYFHCEELFAALLDALYTCWSVNGRKVFQRVLGHEFTEDWFQEQSRKLPNFKFTAILPKVSDLEEIHPNTEVVYPSIRVVLKPASREE